MDFEFRQDVAAPIAAVRAAVTDFPAFERQALRRGAEVRRVEPAQGAPGPAWDILFQFRGHDRQVLLTVTENSPEMLVLTGDSQGVAFRAEVGLLSLAPRQTRLTLRLALLPKTLAAKLLVQSLRLARGQIGKRVEARLATFARDIEARAKR